MGLENTPPSSPRPDLEDMLDEDIGEENAIEVIDLDEAFGDNEEDDDFDQDGLDTVPEEGSMITQDIKDNADKVFKEHAKSVFCVDVQPRTENTLVASGGEDDVCYVWNLQSGEVLKKLDSFKDSVTHVKFNHDGSYLAVADMSGTIMVVKILPNFSTEPVWSFETGDISWVDWHPGANVLFAGTEDSSFWMWKIPSKLKF